MADEIKRFTTPEGRLINAALFEKDKYDDNSVPAYQPSVCYVFCWG